LFFFSSICDFLVINPYVKKENDILIKIKLVLFILSFIFFCFSWLKDPGYLRKK
jgi:hypothetical protein